MAHVEIEILLPVQLQYLLRGLQRHPLRARPPLAIVIQPVVATFLVKFKTTKIQNDGVGSTSSCPVLLASEMSGLRRKVHRRRKPAGGCTRGAAAPLVGVAASTMRASVLCWRAAGMRRGGNPPAPAFPRRGKRERGRSDSLRPQAILITQPAYGVPAAVLRCAPWVAERAGCRAPTWLPREARTAPPPFHPKAHRPEHGSPPMCSASGSFRFVGCGCPARSCCPDSPASHAGSRTPMPDPSGVSVQTHCLGWLRQPQSAG